MRRSRNGGRAPISRPSSRRRARRRRLSPRGRGRLIFALDATMSRQATWDLAQDLQARMFQVAADLGGLDVQLVYFRGFNECRASNFVSGGQGLARSDGARSTCAAARRRSAECSPMRATRRGAPRSARWCSSATRWRRASTACWRKPANSRSSASRRSCSRRATIPNAARAFQEIARLTGGAYGTFDAGAAHRLEALLARRRRLCRRRQGGAGGAGAEGAMPRGCCCGRCVRRDFDVALDARLTSSLTSEPSRVAETS